MKSIYKDSEPAPTIPRLALRPREAAIALGMSEKALWSITAPRGSLMAVKIGSRVAYFCHHVQAWADRELARQQAQQPVGTEGGEV